MNTPPNCRETKSVLQGLRADEKWAFECLAQRCSPVFFNHAIGRCARNKEDVEDIYSDCLVNLIELLPNPEFAPDDIFAYFYTMLRNRCRAVARINARRLKKGKEPSHPPDKELPEEDDEDMPILDFEDYCDCLRHLFEKNESAALVIVHRDVDAFKDFPHRQEGTCLEDIESKTDEELARELQTTIGYVRQLRIRGRKKLQECLEQKK